MQSRDTPAETDSNLLSEPSDDDVLDAFRLPRDFLVKTTRRGKHFTQPGARHHSPALMHTGLGGGQGSWDGEGVGDSDVAVLKMVL